MKAPLDGIRVLDLSTTFSGPYCTQQLVDYGADVLKIETPTGDITRSLGTAREQGLASIYLAANRGKASVALDLKREGDARRFRNLVAAADVLVHNMRLDAASRLGLDAANLLAVNPRLVHVAITGFGSDGPYAGRPAYDDTIQAMTGLAWLQSRGGEPAYMATALADKVAGQAAASAVLAGLIARGRDGEGQAIEVPMFETVAAFSLMEQWGGRAFSPPLGPTDYPRLRSAHRRPFQTADGVISVVVYHAGHWQRFLGFLGRADILDREEYATPEARSHNIDGLYEIVATELRRRTTAEWLEILSTLDVPAAPVLTLDELFDDPHLRAVDFFYEYGDSSRRYMAARPTARFSRTPLQRPRVDELPHVLGEGGLDADRWLS